MLVSWTRLLNIVNKYKFMFDISLGTWEMYPVDFKLKYCVNTVLSLPCLVTKIHEEFSIGRLNI